MPVQLRRIPEMGRTEWAMLLVFSVLWGGSFLFNGILVQSLPPLTIVAGRVGSAAVALWFVVMALRMPVPRGGRTWAILAGLGMLNNILPCTLIVMGQEHISAGLAAIFIATTPLFTVLLAHVLTSDERLTPGRVAGVLLGLAGVVVLVGPDVLQGLGQDVVAQVAVILAAVSYACAGILGKRFREHGLTPIATATGQVTATVVLLAPVALWLDRPWTLGPLAPQAWLALVGLGVFSTALASILYFRILARAGATNVLLVTMLVPVSAAVLGALVLHEQLRPGQVLGMGLIALGLLAIDGRLSQMISVQVVAPPPVTPAASGHFGGSPNNGLCLHAKIGSGG